MQILTQEQEADVGFKTAVALQDQPADAVICWDSGGASFQITACDPSGGLRSYLGSYGTAVTTALLVESVQGRKYAECPSPNPVSMDDANALMSIIKSELQSVPAWLSGSSTTAIGGPNSMFCVASEALGINVFDVSSLRHALEGVVGSTDEELAARAFCQGELREPPSYIVPKLCLLLAVAEHSNMEQITFCPAIGSCQGLLISDDMYATMP